MKPEGLSASPMLHDESCDNVGSILFKEKLMAEEKRKEKTFKSFLEQIEGLKKKNLKFKNEDFALNILEKVNYYSLINGYKDIFLDSNYIKQNDDDPDEKYKEDTYFEDIFYLYYFDTELRNVLLRFIFEFEENIKTKIAYYFTEKFKENNNAYLEKNNFDYEVEALQSSIDKLVKKLEKTIEKQKSHFSEISIILTAGIYTVGIDFPQGKYTLTAKENYGDVITSDNVKNGINQTLGVGYRDIASEFNNLILENGDTLTIDGELVLKLYSQRVNLVVAPREVRGQEINLIAGNYICGKDFEEGTYDIELIKNYGYITIREKNNMSNIKFSKYLGEDKRELKGFKNCSVEAGDKLEISGGLVVKLTPSKSTYLYS